MVRLSGEERRRQLADITLHIIAKRGLRKFTVAELASAASISEGTIFRHFKNKEEIVEAAIERMEEVLFQGFPPRDEDPLARLGAFFQRRLQLVSKNPNVVGLVFSEQLVHAAGKSGEEKIFEMRKRSREFVYGCLREAHHKRLVDQKVKFDHLFFVVYGTMAAMVSVLLEREAHPSVKAPTPAQLWKTLENLIRG